MRESGRRKTQRRQGARAQRERGLKSVRRGMGRWEDVDESGTIDRFISLSPPVPLSLVGFPSAPLRCCVEFLNVIRFEIRHARQEAPRARRVVALTGRASPRRAGSRRFAAPKGCGVSSGRGLATPQAFARDPVLVWECTTGAARRLPPAPNDGHRALAALGRRSFAFDPRDPERRRSSSAHGVNPVFELHGSLWNLHCTGCSRNREDWRAPLFPRFHRGASAAVSSGRGSSGSARLCLRTCSRTRSRRRAGPTYSS
jgi:hypothetical protein